MIRCQLAEEPEMDLPRWLVSLSYVLQTRSFTLESFWNFVQVASVWPIHGLMIIHDNVLGCCWDKIDINCSPSSSRFGKIIVNLFYLKSMIWCQLAEEPEMDLLSSLLSIEWFLKPSSGSFCKWQVSGLYMGWWYFMKCFRVLLEPIWHGTYLMFTWFF